MDISREHLRALQYMWSLLGLKCAKKQLEIGIVHVKRDLTVQCLGGWESLLLGSIFNARRVSVVWPFRP